MPAAAQFFWMNWLGLSAQLMQGSIASCERKPVWSARYSSNRPGARYEVPMVPRTRKVGIGCQFRPYFQTRAELPTEPYLNSRPDRSTFNDSTAGSPFRIGTPTSPNTSVTWSAPLVSPAEVSPHEAGGGLSSIE